MGHKESNQTNKYIAVILRKDGIFEKFVETRNQNGDVGGLLEM